MQFSSYTVTLCGIVLVTGCGNHRSSDAQRTARNIPECDAFVEAYEQCVGALGPPKLTAARIEQTRAGISAQIAASTDESLPVIRAQCVQNLSQLKATCR
jgi:hypothetical protein